MNNVHYKDLKYLVVVNGSWPERSVTSESDTLKIISENMKKLKLMFPNSSFLFHTWKRQSNAPLFDIVKNKETLIIDEEPKFLLEYSPYELLLDPNHVYNNWYDNMKSFDNRLHRTRTYQHYAFMKSVQDVDLMKFDKVVRTRWDVILSEEKIQTDLITRTNVVGYHKEAFIDFINNKNFVGLNDLLIVMDPSLIDKTYIRRLENKEGLPAEWGWYQMLLEGKKNKTYANAIGGLDLLRHYAKEKYQ